MQLLIIIFLSLLFPIGVGYTLMRFKKRKNAGRTVLTVAAPAGDAVNIRMHDGTAGAKIETVIRTDVKEPTDGNGPTGGQDGAIGTV